MEKQLVIVGIGTDVGKTVVSAIVAEALESYYLKPIQAGDLHLSDSMKITKYCSDKVRVLPELFRLNTPASPHYAAELDGIHIGLEDLKVPQISENLVLEAAGGLYVPINSEGLLFIDLLEVWKLPVIVVSRHYLGSINHTLLSINALKNKGIEIELLVFVGDENKATEEAIQVQFPELKTHRIPLVQEVNSQFITNQAKRLRFFL